MNAELAQHLEDLGIDLGSLTPDDILTGAEAARRAGVKPSAITNWRERGYRAQDGTWQHLRNIGTPDRPRYLSVDVARAERDTRRPGVIRRRTDIASYQMNELWDEINPEAAA